MIVQNKPFDITDIIVRTRVNGNLDNQQVWDKIPKAYIRGFLKENREYINAPYTERVNSETRIYNCHGLTFASRRTNISDEQVNQILKEDNYEKIVHDKIQAGDVAIYLSEEGVMHSGIVIRIIQGYIINTKNTIILSKWGMMGEYLHQYDICPYMKESQIVEFYRIKNEKRN